MPSRSDWSLKQFSAWYLGDGLSLKIRVPGEDAIRVSENFSELVIYREAPFQAMLVMLFPGYDIQPHSHPHVDSYAFSLTGDGEAIVGGRRWTKHIQDRPRLDLRIPVLANVTHSGYTAIGSVFLALQKWKDGVAPGFLSEDWTGA